MHLLTEHNPKLAKGTALGYLSVVLHLAPHDLSGVNLCPWASPGCASACLNLSGRGGIMRKGESTNAIQRARLARAQWFLADRPAFLAQLRKEIRAAERKAARLGLKLAVRLNGTSDLPWERIAPELFGEFGGVQFYDYTKAPHRMFERMPRNYRLTFSRSETNRGAVLASVLETSGNVAVVFRDRIPAEYMGRPVIDGTEHDLRFLDAPGVVVGLRASGKAKRDASGFVVD